MSIDIKDIVSKIRTKRINQKIFSKVIIASTHILKIHEEMEKILMNELNKKDESTL